MGGGINGFLSDTRYFPEEDLYIICLVNTTGPKGGGFFADEITWKLLEKKENEDMDLDIDTKDLEGKYTGAVRGYTQTLEVKSIPNGLTLQEEERDKIDSLTTYSGNNTWMMGNSKITIQNNEVRIDQPSAYYILKKVE